MRRRLLLRFATLPADLPWTPERALAAAVLEQATIDLHPTACARHPQAAAAARSDARRWIADSDDTYLFSFIRICEALHLDPQAARRSLDGAPRKRHARAKC